MRNWRKWVLVALVVLVLFVVVSPELLAQSGGGGGGGWVDVPANADQSWWDMILQGLFYVAMTVGTFALLLWV